MSCDVEHHRNTQKMIYVGIALVLFAIAAGFWGSIVKYKALTNQNEQILKENRKVLERNELIYKELFGKELPEQR